MLVLAGGGGRRIGGAKPLKILGGRTLLDRATDKARRWSTDVRLSLRNVDQIGPVALPILLDDPEIEGPLGAIAMGLGARRPWLLTLPCDMPFVPDDLPDRLFANIGASRVALAMSGGVPHPVCGLWRNDAFDALAAYLATGRRSVRGFAEAAGCAMVAWADDPFFNINDRAALAEAAQKLSTSTRSPAQ